MKSNILVLTFGNIPASPTGLATSVLRRCKVLAENNVETTILVEEYDPDFFYNINSLRNNQQIIEKTNVRNMFIELGGDTEDNRDEIDPIKKFKEDGYIFVPDAEKPYVLRGYKNGLYEIFLWSKDDKLYFVDYLEPDFKRTRREWYDRKGYVRKVDYMNAANKPIRQVYLNQSGYAYLSVLLDGGTQKIKQMLLFKGNEFIKSFETKQDLVKYWFSTKILDKNTPNIMISEYGVNFAKIQELEQEFPLKTIYTLHNNHLAAPHTYGSEIKSDFKGFLSKISEVENLVVLTDEQKIDLMKQFNTNTNITVIPHHVPKNTSTKERDKYKVVMVGRFEKIKGFEDGIKAFKKVVEVVPQAKLEIYGRGVQEQEYIKLIKENGLEDKVTIKGFTNSVYDVFTGASISIVPSHYEGICLSMMESMSCGCIPVVYDFNYGPRYVIQNYKNGVIVGRGNTVEMADSIISILSNDSLREEISKNASQIVDTFSEERLFKDWMNLLDKLDKTLA